jgi:hypothetical protein
VEEEKVEEKPKTRRTYKKKTEEWTRIFNT